MIVVKFSGNNKLARVSGVFLVAYHCYFDIYLKIVVMSTGINYVLFTAFHVTLSFVIVSMSLISICAHYNIRNEQS